jgi:hypothetical protein
VPGIVDRQPRARLTARKDLRFGTWNGSMIKHESYLPVTTQVSMAAVFRDVPRAV